MFDLSTWKKPLFIEEGKVAGSLVFKYIQNLKYLLYKPSEAFGNRSGRLVEKSGEERYLGIISTKS